MAWWPWSSKWVELMIGCGHMHAAWLVGAWVGEWRLAVRRVGGWVGVQVEGEWVVVWAACEWVGEWVGDGLADRSYVF